MDDSITLRRDIIAIGASAGGVSVLMDLTAALPRAFPASLLVVQHIGSHRSVLPELLNAKGRMPAVHADSGQTLQPGAIYVAPPDRHMMVLDGHIHLSGHAKENHARPAIDPLFRSVAISHGPRVIGVIISGRLDDGTVGLQAIKACGGLAVVQDPADAEEPSMPASACENVAVDHVVTRATLADTLQRLAGQPVGDTYAAPNLLLCEQRLSLREGNAMDHLDAIGTPSHITCPDCNGVLWQITGSQPLRYRCHTGHAFTVRSLAHTHAQRADESLWRALRSLNEREALLREMAQASRLRNDVAEAEQLEAEAEHAELHARQLQRLATSEP